MTKHDPLRPNTTHHDPQQPTDQAQLSKPNPAKPTAHSNSNPWQPTNPKTQLT